ncbi:MAG: hypothetical protein M1814_004583 [Vezdaea aestivalis]|nr:MAG: hypothetical protein M1814_004583 [Vezdaea aestivalis]
MAGNPKNHMKRNSSSSSNASLPNILASCYVVTGRTAQGLSGVPEVRSGSPSPPGSPPLAALDRNIVDAQQGRGGQAARSITEGCERLFCEAMATACLVRAPGSSSPTTSATSSLTLGGSRRSSGSSGTVIGSPLVMSDADSNDEPKIGKSKGNGGVQAWFEVWDYASGNRFRGFVLGDATMVVFFEDDIYDRDLKQGLMAILEMASEPAFDCPRLVICLERSRSLEEIKKITRDLSWVGFGISTLNAWADTTEITSRRWIYMSMNIE